MKISVELTLEPDEIPLATELFAVLQQITTQIKPRNARQLYEQLFRQLDAPTAKVPDVATSLNQLLSIQAAESADETVTDLFDAFVAALFTTDYVARHSPAERYVAVIPQLVQPYGFNFLSKLVLHIVQQLGLPRPVDSDRLDFFALTETLAMLARLNLINVEVMLKTIMSMIPKQEMRCAAVTALGKLIEHNGVALKEKCTDAHWAEFDAALRQVNDSVLQYDVSYIRQNLASHGVQLGVSATPSISLGPVGGRNASASIIGSASASPFTTPTGRPTPMVPAAVVSGTPARTPSSNGAVRSGRMVGLLPKESFAGHNERVFNLVYDELNSTIISSDESGFVLGRTASGRIVHQTQLPGFFSCGLDVNPKANIFLVAAKEKPQTQNKTSIIAYDLSPGNGTLRNLGLFPKPDVRVISAIKALPGRAFATGEVMRSNKQTLMSVYDYEKLGNGVEPKPVYSWSEHKDLIICFARHPDQEHLLFSGSKDKTVHVWDLRQTAPAAVLGRVGGDTTGVGHNEAITSLSVVGNSVLTADLKQSVLAWDLRAVLTPSAAPRPIASTQLAEGVIKILHAPAFAPDTAVVSTAGEGVHVLSYLTGQLSAPYVFPGGTPAKSYVDMAWDASRSTLFCGGTDGTLDLFEPQLDL